MPHLNIFLSHLNIERKLAELLQTAIARDFIGLTDFFVSSDRTTIPAGDKWLPRLIEGLARSDLHMVLCSPESVKRPWINFETGAACLKNIPIIPVLHSGLNPRQLLPPLSEFESVSASDSEGVQKLYGRIAAILGSRLPDSKLADLLLEIEAFEAGYRNLLDVAAKCESTPTSVVTLRSPQVLCVTSNQFLSLRPDDFGVIQAAFPETATHRRELSSRSVRDALMHQSFDIVHVATYVCPKTGDLIFSDVDLDSLGETCQPTDVIPAEAFVDLIKNANTKLVVIASCESFELAVEVLSVSDVISTRDMISVDVFAAWIENFYQALQVKTLAEAFDYAVKASRAPMKLYAKQNLLIRKADKDMGAAIQEAVTG